MYLDDEDLPMTDVSQAPKVTFDRTTKPSSVVMATLTTISTPFSKPSTLSDDFPYSSQLDFEQTFDNVNQKTLDSTKAFDSQKRNAQLIKLLMEWGKE